MNTINRFLLILLTITTIISCKRDSEEFTIIQSETHQSKIIGIVVDENNEPIEGAVAHYNNATATTDVFGIYEFVNVSVNSQHNTLSIEKHGYFNGYRTFRSGGNGILNQRTMLIEEIYNHSFNASIQENINDGEITLEFPANSMVVASTGVAYTGNVQMAVTYVDPFDASRMPGDLTAVNESNEFETLSSYGMVKVSLKGSGGQKLQVKPGTTVSMTSEIPDFMVADAPATIPTWHFDIDNGVWKEEGLAVKNGSTYQVEVPHFSWWNFDIPNSSIVVTGILIDNEGIRRGQTGIGVGTLGGQRGGIIYTNQDGTFSQRMPRNEALKLYLSDSECADPFNGAVIKQIGGFDGDVNIGEVILPDISKSSLKVTGTLLTCEGEPVSDGGIHINGRYFTIKDGELDAILMYCANRPNEISYKAFNRETIQATTGVVSVIGDEVDLGELKACEEEEEHFFVTCEELGISTSFTELHLDLTPGREFHIRAYNGSEQFHLGAYYADEISTNTYEVHQGKYYFSAGNYVQTTTPTSTVTHEYNADNNTYFGTIRVFLLVNGNAEEFTGSYQINGG